VIFTVSLARGLRGFEVLFSQKPSATEYIAKRRCNVGKSFWHAMLSDWTGANSDEAKQSGNRAKARPFPAVKGERMARRIRLKRPPENAVAAIVKARFDCRIHALENAFNQFGPFDIERDENEVALWVSGAD